MAGAGYKLFNTGDVLTAAQVNTYLQEQTVMVFASSAARTSALSGVLAEGMVSYLQDTNAVEVYNGSAWVSVSGAGDVTEVQAGTGISVASGTGPIPVVTNTMATEITAKGDLIVGTGSGTFDNLPAGTNGYTLVADSSVSPTGLKWAVDPVADVITTAGDLIYGTAADTVARLGIGTAGQVLKVNSGATAPEWGAASSTPTFVGCRLKQTSGQTVSNNTATALQWNSEDYDTDAFHDNSTNNTRVTIPSGKAGKYLFVGNCFSDAGATADVGRMGSSLYKNGVNLTNTTIENTTSASSYETWTIHTVLDLAVGDYIQWYVSQTSGGDSITTDASFCVSYLGA